MVVSCVTHVCVQNEWIGDTWGVDVSRPAEFDTMWDIAWEDLPIQETDVTVDDWLDVVETDFAFLDVNLDNTRLSGDPGMNLAEELAELPPGEQRKILRSPATATFAMALPGISKDDIDGQSDKLLAIRESIAAAAGVPVDSVVITGVRSVEGTIAQDAARRQLTENAVVEVEITAPLAVAGSKMSNLHTAASGEALSTELVDRGVLSADSPKPVLAWGQTQDASSSLTFSMSSSSSSDDVLTKVKDNVRMGGSWWLYRVCVL